MCVLIGCQENDLSKYCRYFRFERKKKQNLFSFYCFMKISSRQSSHFLRKTERKKHQMTSVENPNPLFLEFVN